MGTLCHNAFGSISNEAWVIDELDGTPTVEHVESIEET